MGMKCRFCEESARVKIYIKYVWGETLKWHVCQACWDKGKEDPFWLGSRRDRQVTGVAV